MKNTKNQAKMLLKSDRSHGPIVRSSHQDIQTPAANNEELETPTEVVIVDFHTRECQQKVLNRELPKY